MDRLVETGSLRLDGSAACYLCVTKGTSSAGEAESTISRGCARWVIFALVGAPVIHPVVAVVVGREKAKLQRIPTENKEAVLWTRLYPFKPRTTSFFVCYCCPHVTSLGIDTRFYQRSLASIIAIANSR